MNTVTPFSIQYDMSDEVNLHILSFLDKRGLQSMACTCGHLEGLAQDYLVWKIKAESDFGKFVAIGAKIFSKSWKQTYLALDKSKENRIQNLDKVLYSHVHKVKTDDVQFHTQRDAANLFGFAMPDIGTHYYPTGQVGNLGGHKITVFRKGQ